MKVTYRSVGTSEYPSVARFYEGQGYSAAFVDNEFVLVAEVANGIVGAVRLTPEFGHLVLRGMFIDPEYQRRGVGTRMLRLLDEQMGERDCLCIPHEHLQGFYALVGFEHAALRSAPTFIQERASSYADRGYKVVFMKRPGR